ncbi:MAG TPA: acyl-protein synthetase [Candidatus Anaerobiospirillum stercoravium]|nr:acyl-protein synthetase [Candidatus Anaerobiospirillum stercoravium]
MLTPEASLSAFFDHAPYALEKARKLALLGPHLQHLKTWHEAKCPDYAALSQMQDQMLAALTPANLSPAEQLELTLPLVHVQLFKLFGLKSISDAEIYKTMTSSGTSGQAVSRIYLDQATAILQSKALGHIMADFLGQKRRTMLIIDSKAVLKDPKMFSARGAGILGMMPFGRGHTYALDDNYELNLELMLDFLQQHQAEPLLLFGFTFMVWQNLVQKLKPVLKERGLSLNLSNAVLIHAGGWKKMQQMAVDNDTFKAQLRQVLGPELKVHNFYGMVEQTGSVYMECEAGHLHVSNFSDLIIRDPLTYRPLGFNQVGVIETISALPLSYPGFALLTEDLGQILGEDDCPCGRKGKYFQVHGRIPKAEVRGCSDVYN